MPELSIKKRFVIPLYSHIAVPCLRHLFLEKVPVKLRFGGLGLLPFTAAFTASSWRLSKSCTCNRTSSVRGSVGPFALSLASSALNA